MRILLLYIIMRGFVAHGSKMVENALYKCPPCSTKVRLKDSGLVQVQNSSRTFLQGRLETKLR